MTTPPNSTRKRAAKPDSGATEPVDHDEADTAEVECPACGATVTIDAKDIDLDPAEEQVAKVAARRRQNSVAEAEIDGIRQRRRTRRANLIPGVR